MMEQEIAAKQELQLNLKHHYSSKQEELDEIE